jgi:hypothetical protein
VGAGDALDLAVEGVDAALDAIDGDFDVTDAIGGGGFVEVGGDEFEGFDEFALLGFEARDLGLNMAGFLGFGFEGGEAATVLLLELAEADAVFIQYGFAQAGEIPEGGETLDAAIDHISLLVEALFDLGELGDNAFFYRLVGPTAIDDVDEHQGGHGGGAEGDLLGGDGGDRSDARSGEEEVFTQLQPLIVVLFHIDL